MIRISEMGVINFADKAGDFSELHFSKSVCKITKLKSRIEHESQGLTLVHDMVVTPSKPHPPTNNFCLYPHPVLRCFWKDPLMTPHHLTSSIFHCYPLPIYHPFPTPKNSDHTPSSSGFPDNQRAPHSRPVTEKKYTYSNPN